MKNYTGLSLFAALFMVFNPPPAAAIAIDFMPAAQTVQTADVFNVDVVISGLFAANEIVSAYDLSVGYDFSVLTATGVSFGPYLGDLLNPSLQDAMWTTPGVVNFAELSFLGDGELAAQQPDSFTLATLSFDALGMGSSALIFLPAPNFGIDVKGAGAQVLPLNVGSGSVTVGPPVSVPEPGTAALMLIALAAFALTRNTRRWKRADVVGRS